MTRMIIYWILLTISIFTCADLIDCMYPPEFIGYDDQRRGVSEEEAHKQHSDMQDRDGETLPGTSASCV